MATQQFTGFASASEETNTSNNCCHCSHEVIVPLATRYISIRPPPRWPGSCYKTQLPFRSQLPEVKKGTPVRRSAREIRENAEKNALISKKTLLEQLRRSSQHSLSNSYRQEGEAQLRDFDLLLIPRKSRRSQLGSEGAIKMKDPENRDSRTKELSGTGHSHKGGHGKVSSRHDVEGHDSAATIQPSDTMSRLSPETHSEGDSYSDITDIHAGKTGSPNSSNKRTSN